MSEHKMPEPVAWRCSWHKRGQVAWVQYHDEIDPLPETWDVRPNEALPLYSAETVRELQAEVERLRAERDAMAKDAERYRWLRSGDNDEAVLRTVKRTGEPFMLRVTALDAAIDAAMKASA